MPWVCPRPGQRLPSEHRADRPERRQGEETQAGRGGGSGLGLGVSVASRLLLFIQLWLKRSTALLALLAGKRVLSLVPPFPPISDSPSLGKQAHLYQCHLLSSSQWPSEIKVLMPFGKIRKQRLREVGSSVKDRATWKVQSWGVNTRFRPRRPAQWFPHPAHSGRQCYGVSSQCVLPHT